MARRGGRRDEECVRSVVEWRRREEEAASSIALPVELVANPTRSTTALLFANATNGAAAGAAAPSGYVPTPAASPEQSMVPTTPSATAAWMSTSSTASVGPVLYRHISTSCKGGQKWGGMGRVYFIFVENSCETETSAITRY